MHSLKLILLFALLSGCNSSKVNTSEENTSEKPVSTSEKITVNDRATFAGGCFWCIETLFAQLNGVDTVISGYTGGSVIDPSYKEICTGNTGHAEVIQIYFDSTQISFAELLEVFFNVHDPTTLNRQGNDVGTQYRSAIFYNSEKQKILSQEYINQIDKSNVFNSKIVTTLEKLDVFYGAEDYHQDYYNQNGEQGYCRAVIRPKVEKFQKQYKDKLK